MIRATIRITCSIAWAASTLSASPAVAEFYRCTGPNGNIVFTDDAATCPGARQHESAAEIQSVGAKSPPPVAKRSAESKRATRSSTEDQAALKRHWQEKKRAKQAELRELEEKTEYLSRFVTGCNRGADVITRDSSGLKRSVPCDEIRSEYEEALDAQRALRDYLADGLRRECRRAGCLPGWVR